MINWAVRFSNRVFVVQLILAIFTPILAYAGLTMSDLTSWPMLFRVLMDAMLNPYVLGLVVVSVFNAVTDPTTAGISDSTNALTYTSPKGGGEA